MSLRSRVFNSCMFLRGKPAKKFGNFLKGGNVSTKHTTTKQYKGVGCRSLGRHTKKGRFIVMENKIPEYIIPDLTGCPLKPYVSRRVHKIKVPPLLSPDVSLAQLTASDEVDFGFDK
eukprot:TRINITY_DN3339_c0_g1_i1.p1 TRINITY_DN3339_c0_g1~~TRINITY_DN3339_c0_g1_i1.p1  ORF type:complete len:117 (-),score=18.25 TRINITY_DN3339_c0_g1_i1:81-431(-)